MIVIMCLSIFLGRNKRLPDEGTKGLVAKKDSSIWLSCGSVPVGRHVKQPFLEFLLVYAIIIILVRN